MLMLWMLLRGDWDRMGGELVRTLAFRRGMRLLLCRLLVVGSKEQYGELNGRGEGGLN